MDRGAWGATDRSVAKSDKTVRLGTHIQSLYHEVNIQLLLGHYALDFFS